MPDTIPPVDDAPEDPDVDFERWAQVSARLLRRTVAERAKVLSESGIGGAWPEIDSRWFEALADDIEAGRLERVDRYAEVCAAEISERDRASSEPPLDRLLGRTLEVIAPQDADEGPSPSSTPPFGKPAAEDGDDIEVDVEVADERTGELTGTDEALGWPIEKYAWLCAELEQSPERAEQLWTAHGVDKKMRAVVSEAWSERLANDERLQTQLKTLVTRFRKMLQA